MSELFVEITAYAFSFILIGSYYHYLRSRLNRDRNYTIQSVNNDARAAWVDNIMSDRSKDLLAIQTLRNSTMAATFLASTAILLIMGVLNLIHNNSGDHSMLESLQQGLINDGNLEDIKLLLLLLPFFSAFFCFSLAVRMYNHIGYLINSTSSKMQFCPTTAYVTRLLNRSGRYYSYGMRSYYIAVPLIFGLFSPYFLVAVSIILVAILHHIDRTPEAQPSDSDIRKHTPSSRFHFKPQVAESSRESSGLFVHDRTALNENDFSKKAG